MSSTPRASCAEGDGLRKHTLDKARSKAPHEQLKPKIISRLTCAMANARMRRWVMTLLLITWPAAKLKSAPCPLRP